MWLTKLKQAKTTADFVALFQAMRDEVFLRLESLDEEVSFQDEPEKSLEQIEYEKSIKQTDNANACVKDILDQLEVSVRKDKDDFMQNVDALLLSLESVIIEHNSNISNGLLTKLYELKYEIKFNLSKEDLEKGNAIFNDWNARLLGEFAEFDIDSLTNYQCNGKILKLSENDKIIMRKYFAYNEEYKNEAAANHSRVKREFNNIINPVMTYLQVVQNKIESIALLTLPDSVKIAKVKDLVSKKLKLETVNRADLDEVIQSFNEDIIDPINSQIETLNNQCSHSFLNAVKEWAIDTVDNLKAFFGLGKVSEKRVMTDSISVMHASMWRVKQKTEALQPKEPKAINGNSHVHQRIS